MNKNWNCDNEENLWRNEKNENYNERKKRSEKKDHNNKKNWWNMRLLSSGQWSAPWPVGFKMAEEEHLQGKSTKNNFST